jgi:hypothetical protein
MDWKSLLARIPNKVQVTSKIFYEILWSPKIHKAEDACGLMRPDTKQIIIEQGHPPKLTTVIYLHEVLHAFSEEYDLKLTENQILKMEKALYYALKEGNLFK